VITNNDNDDNKNNNEPGIINHDNERGIYRLTVHGISGDINLIKKEAKSL
jgi:hypothetical protein